MTDHKLRHPNRAKYTFAAVHKRCVCVPHETLASQLRGHFLCARVCVVIRVCVSIYMQSCAYWLANTQTADTKKPNGAQAGIRTRGGPNTGPPIIMCDACARSINRCVTHCRTSRTNKNQPDVRACVLPARRQLYIRIAGDAARPPAISLAHRILHGI